MLITDKLNLTLTILLFLIYGIRTYFMCKFDKEPIWRMPVTSSGPDYLDNMYPKESWDLVSEDAETNTTIYALPLDLLSEHYYPSGDCTGEFHFYYYTLLMMAHIYFLIEFLMRALASKDISNFLHELDSMIEIFTTVPFFMLWAILGKENYYFQLFLALDTMRLMLYDRYMAHIKTELTKGIGSIVTYLMSLIMISSIVIQFVENQYRYEQGISSGHTTNSDNVVEEYDLMISFNFFQSFYFIMTTVSVVGYGSYISSLQGKLALIVIIIIIIVTIPEKATDLVTLLNSKSKYALA